MIVSYCLVSSEHFYCGETDINMKSEMLSLLPDCERNFSSLNFNYLHLCSNILNLPTGIAKEELFNCLIVD